MWFIIKHWTRLTTNSNHCVGLTCHGHENYHNNEISKIHKTCLNLNSTIKYDIQRQIHKVCNKKVKMKIYYDKIWKHEHALEGNDV